MSLVCGFGLLGAVVLAATTLFSAAPAPLDPSVTVAALRAAGEVDGQRYQNSALQLALELPSDWRRLDYARDTQLVTFARRTGGGSLSLGCELPEPGQTLEATVHAPRASTHESATFAELGREAVEVARLQGVRVGYEVKLGETLQVFGAMKFVTEELRFAYRGRVVRLAWTSATGQQLSDVEWADIAAGVRLGEAQTAGQPFAPKTSAERTAHAIRSGKVSGRRYRNRALGLRLRLPSGLQQAKATAAEPLLYGLSPRGDRALQLNLSLQPMGPHPESFLDMQLGSLGVAAKTHPTRVAGRPAATTRYSVKDGEAVYHAQGLCIVDQDRTYHLLWVSLTPNDPEFTALRKSIRFD